MGVPTVPLTELYDARGSYITARGGEVRLRSGVDAFRRKPGIGDASAAGNDVL